MPYPSQLAEMRTFLEDEALEFLIIGSVDDDLNPVWHCNICHVETSKQFRPTRSRAKHTTFCTLGNILGVVE